MDKPSSSPRFCGTPSDMVAAVAPYPSLADPHAAAASRLASRPSEGSSIGSSSLRAVRSCIVQ
jgi:hypothetical protein